MVVLHHDALARTLWGPASTTGRSRTADIAVYIQLVLVALLGGLCALDYEKPQAVRLAVAAGTLLVYFRSTALFVRLMLFVTAVVLYGDVLVPIKRLAGDGEVRPLLAAKLALYCMWICNTLRVVYAIFKSGALKAGDQRRKRPMPGAFKRRPKMT